MCRLNSTRVPVAVALIINENSQVLWVLNARSGEFALPMRAFDPESDGPGAARAAALRAGAQALGVPVRLVEGRSTHHEFPPSSTRRLLARHHAYDLFRVEPHPDFAGRTSIRRPHLWLNAHLSLAAEYEPLSVASKRIVFHMLDDFHIPVRLQHTSVLIVRRQCPERGPQFLLRWDPDWGYALPARRRDATEPTASGAERVAREELGLEPGRDVILAAAPVAEVRSHVVSGTEGSPAYGAITDYVHAPFDAEVLHHDRLRSAQPLIWATADEIHAGLTTAAHAAGRSPRGKAGKVSTTVAELLEALDDIDEDLSADARRDLEDYIRRLESRQGRG